MKFAKTIGIVVGVVALAATGVGLALGGATAAAAGAAAGTTLALGSTLMTVGAIASVASGLIGIATAVFAPKPGFSSGGNPLAFQTNPQSGLPYWCGRTRMSGLRIHADTYDSPTWKSESKDDVVAFAVMLSAGGGLREIEKFRADKEEVTFDGNGTASGSFTGWMAQKVSLGYAGASALALTFGGVGFPGWTADHKLTGIAHALWDLRGDPKGQMFGAGVPEPEWVGKGLMVYDPRQDSTYPGGSGSHRAGDESTYSWESADPDNPAGANPYLQALTWAIGRWQNGKKTLGIGAPIENIRVADFVEGANVADANGWRSGGIEWSTDPKWTTFKRMLQAGGGEPTMTGAMIGCRVKTPRVSVTTFTADKLHDGLSVSTTRSRRDRFNTVIPRFRSEDHDWGVISGSPISVAEYVTEDGGVRTKEIDFPLVQHERDTDGNAQAGQLSAYEIVDSREGGPIRFTGGPEYVGVKTGDCVTLDVPEEGFDAQKVLIRRKTPDATTFKFAFEAETETDAKHDFALGKTTTPPPTYEPTPPDLTPPTPASGLWSLVAPIAGEITPSMAIVGVCEFPGADSVVMEYRPTGAADWISLGKAEASEPVNHVISALIGDTEYEARIAYQSGNRIGPWRTLDPVTTDAYALVDLVDDFGDLSDEFHARNDRIATTPVAPTMPGGGITNRFEWSQNDDGTVAIKSKIAFNVSDEAANDDFEVEVWSSTSNAAYTPGSDAKALVTSVPIRRRTFVIASAPGNLWYTISWRTTRDVDPDVWATWAAANPTLAATTSSGKIVSAWVKSTTSGENPWQPTSTPESSVNVLGTVDGLDATIISAGFDPITGNVATGKVVTDSIFDGAVSQTVRSLFAVTQNISYLTYPDYYAITDGTGIITEGGRVIIDAEAFAWVTYTASLASTGDLIGAEFIVTRCDFGCDLVTTLDDWMAAELSCQIILPSKTLIEMTHDGTVTTGTIYSQKNNMALKVKDDPDAGLHVYQIWARPNSGTRGVVRTTGYQNFTLTELKK